jgi:hypothetical protein
MDMTILSPQPPMKQENPSDEIPANLLEAVYAFDLPRMPQWYVLVPDKRPEETGGFPVWTKDRMQSYARDAIIDFVIRSEITSREMHRLRQLDAKARRPKAGKARSSSVQGQEPRQVEDVRGDL